MSYLPDDAGREAGSTNRRDPVAGLSLWPPIDGPKTSPHGTAERLDESSHRSAPQPRSRAAASPEHEQTRFFSH
jgi:hypothetical protein